MVAKELWKEKEYLKMQAANLVNRFGDSIDAIAMTWLVYAVSENAAISALNFGINWIPTVLFQPLAGAFVERRNKKRIMIAADLGRGAIVFLIGLLSRFGRIESGMILLATFVLSTLEAFRLPCTAAMIPCLLKKENYADGQAFASSTARTVELIGTAMAGVILAWGGVETAIWTDALTFFLSALILCGLRPKPALKSNEKKRSEWALLKEGLAYLGDSKKIVLLCFLGMLMNGLLIPFNSLQSALVAEVYHKGPEVLSLMGIALSVGSIAGELGYPLLSRKIPAKQMVLALLSGIGVFYLCCVQAGRLIDQTLLFSGLLAGISLLLGGAAACYSTFVSVAMLQSIEPDYLARMSAVFNALSSACTPLGSFLISAMALVWSTGQIFVATGILTLGLTAGLAFSPVLHGLEGAEEKHENHDKK